MDGYLTVEEAHGALLIYITENPDEPYARIAKLFGYTPQYIGRLAKEAGLPPRIGPNRLSKVLACVKTDLVGGSYA
jgi:hypothetical protein